MTRDYKRSRIVLLLLMFLTAVPLSAGQGEPFTNEDVLEMVEAGFAEATVLEAIQANEVDFDTSVDALLALKNAGVGENIILEMLGAAQHDSGLSNESPEGVALPTEIGVYVLEDGFYQMLPVEPVEWEPTGRSSSSGRVSKLWLRTRMGTRRSDMDLPDGPELVAVCPEGVSAIELHLLRAQDKKERREFRIILQESDGGVLVGESGTSKNAVRFEAEKVATGTFRVKLPLLEKGEYAFLPREEGVGSSAGPRASAGGGGSSTGVRSSSLDQKLLYQALALVTGEYVSPIDVEKVKKSLPSDLPRVILYRTSWCPACEKTEWLLRRLSVPFTEKDVELSRVAKSEMERKTRGSESVPVTDIGGTIVRGYDPDRIVSALMRGGGGGGGQNRLPSKIYTFSVD
jgi:glutaredoxin